MQQTNYIQLRYKHQNHNELIKSKFNVNHWFKRYEQEAKRLIPPITIPSLASMAELTTEIKQTKILLTDLQKDYITQSQTSQQNKRFISGLYAINQTRHQHLSQQLLALIKNNFNFACFRRKLKLLHT